jgi:hypothetical protein
MKKPATDIWFHYRIFIVDKIFQPIQHCTTITKSKLGFYRLWIPKAVQKKVTTWISAGITPALSSGPPSASCDDTKGWAQYFSSHRGPPSGADSLRQLLLKDLLRSG